LETLKNAILHISQLSEDNLQAYLQAWKRWEVPKDHLLVRPHAWADHIFFIESGLAKIYYHKDKKEITEWFAMDGTFCLSIASFFEKKPGKLIIQTLEPSVVYGIHYNDLHELAAKHHEIETLYRKMLSLSLMLSQQRMESIQFETAQQRYDALMAEAPGILQRAPLMYIASFLGVTLETLSRIRSAKSTK